MLLNQVLGREVKKEFIHPNMSYNNWSNENQIFTSSDSLNTATTDSSFYKDLRMSIDLSDVSLINECFLNHFV